MNRRKRLAILAFFCLAAGGVMIAWKPWKQRGPEAQDSKDRKADKLAKTEKEISTSSRGRRAVNDFANALRTIFEWRFQQPVAQEADRAATIRTLAQKLKQVPSAELPKTYATAWQAMLAAWGKLAQSPTPDAPLMKEGQEAADALNQLLIAGGYGDLQF
jgi:hypothetical protein